VKGAPFRPFALIFYTAIAVDKTYRKHAESTYSSYIPSLT